MFVSFRYELHSGWRLNIWLLTQPPFFLDGGGDGGGDGCGGGGSFLASEDFGRMFNYLFPACAFFSFSF